MSQSLSALYVHAVFSTKQRAPYLADPEFRRGVFAYMAEVTKRLDCPAIEVGGHVDHVHILVRFSKNGSVSEWVRELKRVTSVFVKRSNPNFVWQTGYGAFSVATSGVGGVSTYIRGQEDHHRVVSFQDELRSLMAEHGLEIDERYIWD